MSERIVISTYRPLEGSEPALENLVQTHWNRLNQEGLVSNRKPVIMKAQDGTIVEIFGWKSKEAIEMAHSNENVQALWAEFERVCEFIPIDRVDESSKLFSEFTPVN